MKLYGYYRLFTKLLRRKEEDEKEIKILYFCKNDEFILYNFNKQF